MMRYSLYGSGICIGKAGVTYILKYSCLYPDYIYSCLSIDINRQIRVQDLEYLSKRKTRGIQSLSLSLSLSLNDKNLPIRVVQDVHAIPCDFLAKNDFVDNLTDMGVLCAGSAFPILGSYEVTQCLPKLTNFYKFGVVLWMSPFLTYV